MNQFMLTLFPRKALPTISHIRSVQLITKRDAEYNVHGEADGDGRIEMPPGCGSARDDRKGDSNRKSPANLEQTPEHGHAQGVLQVDGKTGDGSDPWKAVRQGIWSADVGCIEDTTRASHVEEDARGFGDHLAEPSGSRMLKV